MSIWQDWTISIAFMTLLGLQPAKLTMNHYPNGITESSEQAKERLGLFPNIT